MGHQRRVLLGKEAGAHVFDFAPDEDTFSSGTTLAASPGIAAGLLNAIHAADNPALRL